MSDKLIFEKQVVIAAPQSVVFDFVAEPANDPRWRAEADRLEHPTPFRIGDTVTEHATFQGSELVTPTILSNPSMRTHRDSPTG